MPPRPNATADEILQITLEQIAENDVSGVSVEMIAEKAGVSKATIYRRWPTRDALILEALTTYLQRPGAAPDTGSLRGDLTILLEELIEFLNRQDGGKVFAAFLNASIRNSELSALSEQITREARSAYKTVIKRAIDRGEVCDNLSIPLMIDILISPFLYRNLAEHKPARKRDVKPVIDVALAYFCSYQE